VRILVFTPHYDDAVWSIAEHMLTWLKAGDYVGVCTVFGWTGAPKEDLLAAEHAQAMSLMRVSEHWALDFKDDAHPCERRPQVVGSAMVTEVEHYRPDVVVLPRGIHHPDHIQVSSLRLPRSVATIWYYEELPYYVLYPFEAIDPDPHLRSTIWFDWEMRKHDDFFAFKKALCQTYASQWAPHLERTVYAPERLWGPG